MRISVDRHRCEGHALCEDAAPELFQIDDEGELVVLAADGRIPANQRTDAQNAVQACPIAALKFADDV